MTLRSLEIFTAVVEYGSMTSAAKALFISQSSISQCIAEMESKYGVHLFERLSGGLRLTHTGETLVFHAKKLLAAEKEVLDLLNHESHNPRIRIGSSTTIGACIISELVSEMKIHLPDVSQYICVSNTRAIEDMILKNDLDIALVEGNVRSQDIKVRTATTDCLVLLCSINHPFCGRASVHIDELAGEPLILREVGSGTRAHFEEVMLSTGLDMNIRWSSSGFDAILDAVEHNLGVSAVSERLAKKWMSRGDLHTCAIDGADFTRSFKLIYHKNKFFTEPLHLFAEICCNTVY